ncbi:MULTISPECIES: hypothetical protein [Streptomyces]|jgi:hypothetical protein|uniref:Uncharacterized protein n=3 Tax=Streptomyces TaxID=1883 RepID=A0AA40SER7_9ACTN|nr:MULTISPECIES: hypothetical protein [Streptomyces]MBA8944800.1 hypothetical protein [Streptomyces calvus]MBA8979544.1 hypothetical protein [Streptomyces calvus]GGP44315.1 hypothetical protein GCM10010247_15950 [Streptomyces calvus]
MRSARMVLATATATAALAIAAPAAYADHTGDGGHDDSSYSKEHDKHGKHDKPHGGMHTGGGALTAASEEDYGSSKDPKYDPETYKDKGDSDSEESWSGKQDKEWKHEKPRGGMHTGGGGLADSDVTAGGLAALAVLGTGAYALRRKKASGDMA